MKIFGLLFFFFTSFVGFTQTETASIQGIVEGEEIKEPIPFVLIQLLDSGRIISETTSNFNGEYIFNELSDKKYDLLFSYVGFQTKKIVGITFKKEKNMVVDVELSTQIHVCPTYHYPLIDIKKDDNTIETTYSREELQRLANF